MEFIAHCSINLTNGEKDTEATTSRVSVNRVQINPKLLIWARERARLSLEELSTKKRFEKLAQWESGDLKPTLNQLEDFANTVHIPLGYLFLSKPPEERMPFPDFRTVKGSDPNWISPNLRDTIYTMQRRQGWLSQHLQENGAEKLPFVGSVQLSDDAAAVGAEIRCELNLTEGWGSRIQTWQAAVGNLRQRIETLGVMAVINGVVGNNTSRKLNVQEFRGFALPDRYAPLIFVNGADSKSAQMFTLAHELAHIWLNEPGLSGFNLGDPGEIDIEIWCDQVAAELLVPSQEFREHWRSSRPKSQSFKTLSGVFKVSPLVIARRAKDLEYITLDEFFDFYNQRIRQKRNQGAGGGGDFYENQNLRVGKLFISYVWAAAMEGQIGFKEAFDLTGLYDGTFQNYARTIE